MPSSCQEGHFQRFKLSIRFTPKHVEPPLSCLLHHHNQRMETLAVTTEDLGPPIQHGEGNRYSQFWPTSPRHWMGQRCHCVTWGKRAPSPALQFLDARVGFLHDVKAKWAGRDGMLKVNLTLCQELSLGRKYSLRVGHYFKGLINKLSKRAEAPCFGFMGFGGIAKQSGYWAAHVLKWPGKT